MQAYADRAEQASIILNVASRAEKNEHFDTFR